MENTNNNVLRKLPSVDQILRHPEMAQANKTYSHKLIVEAVRAVLDKTRKSIINAKEAQIDILLIIDEITRLIKLQARSNLRHVINATGVVLHTNLGRSILSSKATQAVVKVAGSYSNLEMDLATGKRGSRYAPLETLLTSLTGAEAALVVNNNAAAVLLSLSTLAKGKEVVVSRGQLVEIGGSFRVPEVMQQSGCILREVGATNKTYPKDYSAAINDDTALLLHVHTSNYRIVGFTRETTVEELVHLGKENGLPVMCDLGSGFLVDLSRYGLTDEPTVQSIVAQGADVVTFSGDKLLGGPQAGIVLGKKRFIELMRKNPLTRAVRIDKMTVAALEATLRAYLNPDMVLKEVPTLRMLTTNSSEIKQRANTLSEALNIDSADCADISVIKDISKVGGGAMPLAGLETFVIAVKPLKITASQLARDLRDTEPAVIGRVQDDILFLDLRTVQPNEENLLASVLSESLRGGKKDE